MKKNGKPNVANHAPGWGSGHRNPWEDLKTLLELM
jgi:hypothetical protein